MKTIIIIGAGAAGLMSAVTILESLTSNPSPSERGATSPEDNSTNQFFHIHIFEKNTSPGKKVILSGGGRCNVTTGIIDKKALLSKYTRGGEFIMEAFSQFSPKKCREWFESHGVPLKCEENNRIFPVSDDGHDIVGAFEKVFDKYRDKVSIHYGEGVSKIDSGKLIVENNGGKGECKKYKITTEKGVYESDILIITTGGNAYSQTGSTGDGYAFARSLGHTITQLGPSLSSFLTSESWMHELSGLVFKNAKIRTYLSSRGTRDLPENGVDSSLRRNDKKKNRDSGIFILLNTSENRNPEGQKLVGSLLLTHFGISGPLTFMVSSHLAWENIEKNHPKILYFSPLADRGFRDWEEYLKSEFQSHPKKILTSILSEKLPRRFAEGFIEEYFPHILTTFVGSVSKIDREKISRLLGEGIPLTLLERRPGDEFVTAGGVSTDEIDPQTMESKIKKNLYFAGEILNVDGYTGGFSLQICWASGYVAGKAIVEEI